MLSRRLSSIGLFTAMMLSPLFGHAAQDDALAQVVERCRTILMKETPPEEAVVRLLAKDLNAEGQWKDIDYEDTSPSDWKPADHLKRARTLFHVLACPEHPLHQDKAIEQAALLALDYWLQHRYQCPNWWWNDIGVPFQMRDILVFYGARMNDARRQGSLEVLEQADVRGKGANLVWLANLVLHHAAMTGNEALAQQCAQQIANEITLGAKQGVQKDFSFYQHGPRLQTFSYGAAFLANTTEIAWQVQETSMAFPKEKLEILLNFCLEGQQWMCRNGYSPPGAKDRQISREGGFRDGIDIDALVYLRKLLPERAPECDEAIKRIQKHPDAAPLLGFRHFPFGDFTVYHQPAYSVFLKTISGYTLPTESFNGENLKGALLHSGDCYIFQEGDEYHDLQPVWDWTLLPGVTWCEGLPQSVSRRPFVGGVGDGAQGLTAMDYLFYEEDGCALGAKKAWFFHDGLVISMIAGLRTMETNAPVRTALDQCRLRGDVQISVGSGPPSVLEAGTHTLKNVHWIYHNRVAYIPLRSNAISVSIGEQTGSWYDINQGCSRGIVREQVFLPILEHGLHPNGAGCAYVIAPGVSLEEVPHLVASPAWEILRNDAVCQAVRFRDAHCLMAVFHEAGALNIGDHTVLSADKPYLILASKQGMRVGNPTFQAGVIRAMMPGGNMININVPKAIDSISVNLKNLWLDADLK